MKAQIEKIGTIENGIAIGWHFTLAVGSPAIDASNPDLVCGWTLEELQEVIDNPNILLAKPQ